MNLQELIEENKNYEELSKKAYSNETPAGERDQIFEKMKAIRDKMWKLIFKNTPQQEYYDKQNICEDAIENIFINDGNTRLEALKFALKLKNSCDIYGELNQYLDNDYSLEKWSEKSVRVYQDCLETYFSYYSNTIKKYKEIQGAARIGAYCLIERVAVETINTLADIAEDLGINEGE